MGFFGIFTIMKVIDKLIGIRVSAKVEEAGLDIEEMQNVHILMKMSLTRCKIDTG